MNLHPPQQRTPTAMRDVLNSNPLLQTWDTPYSLPPFNRVAAEHFQPAFEAVMQTHMAELDAIASETEPPSFTNTLIAFDASGRHLNRIDLLFKNLCSSETSPALQEVELVIAPRLAAHESAIYMHVGLFQRIDALYQDRANLSLDAEQLRLLETVHLDFVRAGALLKGEAKSRYAAVMAELAEACTQFSQNILADEAAFALELHCEADLAGLPDFVRAAARSAAAQRELPADSYVITLSPSIAEPFLTFSDRQDLREIIWRERINRGAHAGEHDNRPLAARIVVLRQEQAALLGYANYADYELANRMAGNTSAVLNLLEQAWQPALEKADADRAILNEKAQELGLATPFAAWDWRYLAEKVRQQRYDLDDAEIKPYFTLENMITAMFDCAGRLFGLKFIEQHNIPLHHPDARLWSVWDRSNAFVGLFIGDNFARPSKRSGAWMSIFRSQSGIAGGTTPIVINNNNFAKAETTLLSFDDVRTLFHEFGHGLHGLLSQVRYERLAGTQVLRDFVELPSQIFENWAKEESVLRQHARHYQSGAVIPTALLDKLKAASQFNQAWATVQYVAPALIDMALHSLPNGTPVDIATFEAEQRELLGVPTDIGQRHYLSHFSHLFSGPWYAAGYYVYMWAEVLDADGYNAFQEAGDPFEPAVANRLLQHIYSTGNKQDPADAYRAFRGGDPKVEPMLRKRGLITA
ncbi:M3 family metallopeptidase [Chitinimonas sp. PSY-7]|uniref:M3 family metallopeptidase n=1 Tax=Chitinimonas sp. PSY-7 TaxID=3459088 RepID=UPI00404028DF